MRIVVTISILLVVISCSTEPVPIEFGVDGCHYCKMTIVDSQFGAEVITSKGKVLKFDALECLVNFSKSNPREEGDNYYTINYLNRTWIKAESGIYLRSKSIPSPMGQYITSLASRNSAEQLQEDYSGVIQTWEELINNFEITNLEID